MYDLLRSEMVSTQLISRGIKDKRVLNAFETVPRELFSLEKYRRLAYEDGPLPIGHDQTISQPYIVALMSEALDIKNNHKVLEIGTGSGYQTAILKELADQVYTIERIKTLQDQAKRVLDELNYKGITYLMGDGSKGYESDAPYDRIIVTAAARSVPPSLISQLAENGKMVIPVGGSWIQELLLVRKVKNKIKTESLGGVRFVPLIEND